MSFVHLHVHTEYSTDAISKIDELFLKAEALGMPGLAITDHGTISGVPEFLRAAGRHPSVKPIVGCEFWLSGLEEGFSHLILLAKNSIGYKNLVKLVSFANTEGLRNKPLISKEKLTMCREGLICTSACIGGEVPQLIIKGKMEEAKQAAQWYKELFGEDFYLEVSLHKCSDTVDLAIPDDRFSYMEQNRKLTALQTAANSGIFQLSEVLGIKVVASNDVHFVSRADGIAQDVMLAIQHGKKVSDPNRIRYSHMEYLKAEEEMRCLFPDHPEVIDNTNCILEKVERYSIWEEVKLPKLSDNPNADLRDKVYKGMILRHLDDNQRIEEELKYIEDKGIADYFLMIKNLVDWVRSKGWAAGPGRGSSSGSLVNYCLGISIINPLEYNLLFERFVSSGQNHFPIIDIDLEPDAMENIYDFFI